MEKNFTAGMSGKFLLALLLAVLLGVFLAGEARGDTYCGKIYTYTDTTDQGEEIITEAELAVKTLEGEVYYPIVLDERMKKTLEDLDGEEVEATGSLVSKDDEDWLAIKSCYRVLYGTFSVTRDEKGKTVSMHLQNDRVEDLEIPVNEKTESMAKELDKKIVRAVGTVVSKSGKATIDLASCCEYVCLKGSFEIDTDDEGHLESIRFECSDEHMDKVATFAVKPTQGVQALAEKFEYEAMDLTGILVNEKGKKWLIVLTCEPATEEEEGADEDDDGGGEDHDK
jgi:hypothetical protein